MGLQSDIFSALKKTIILQLHEIIQKFFKLQWQMLWTVLPLKDSSVLGMRKETDESAQ